MTLGNLTGLAIILVVTTIALSMGSLVLTEIEASDSVAAESWAQNATTEGLSGLDTAAGFLPVN